MRLCLVYWVPHAMNWRTGINQAGYDALLRRASVNALCCWLVSGFMILGSAGFDQQLLSDHLIFDLWLKSSTHKCCCIYHEPHRTASPTPRGNIKGDGPHCSNPAVATWPRFKGPLRVTKISSIQYFLMVKHVIWCYHHASRFLKYDVWRIQIFLMLFQPPKLFVSKRQSRWLCASAGRLGMF